MKAIFGELAFNVIECIIYAYTNMTDLRPCFVEKFHEGIVDHKCYGNI